MAFVGIFHDNTLVLLITLFKYDNNEVSDVNTMGE